MPPVVQETPPVLSVDPAQPARTVQAQPMGSGLTVQVTQSSPVGGAKHDALDAPVVVLQSVRSSSPVEVCSG